MNKFICPGMFVVNKSKNKSGVVITIDRKNGIAVMRDNTRFWSERTKDLEVTSYKEVQ